MNDKDILTIPYVVYESAIEKEDRQQKRLVVIIIILIALLFASNAIWIIAWNSYEYVEEETWVHAEGEGNANYIGEDGEISYGNSLPSQTEQDAS